MITEKRNKFIENAIKVHNNKYSYDNVIFKNIRTEVTITCPIHGDLKNVTWPELFIIIIIGIRYIC